MVACCDRRLFGKTVVLYEVVVTMVVVDSRKKKRKKKLEKIPKLFYSNMNTVQWGILNIFLSLHTTLSYCFQIFNSEPRAIFYDALTLTILRSD